MRRFSILLTLAVGLTLLASSSPAQPPNGQPPKGKKGGGPKGQQAVPDAAMVDDIVARMMAFDANKDGKLTRDEITDTRLLRLFDRSVTNPDGSITKEEMIAVAKRMVAEVAAEYSGKGEPGGKGPGGKGKKGKGGFDDFGGFGGKKGKGGPGAKGGPGGGFGPGPGGFGQKAGKKGNGPGMPGGGMNVDPDLVFNMLAKGGDSIVIANSGMMKPYLEQWAMENGNASGVISRASFTHFYQSMMASLGVGMGPDKGTPGVFGGPPALGQILPSFAQDLLKLTDDQKKQVESLQSDVNSKLDKILTDDQKKLLKELRDRVPGGPKGPTADGK